MNSTHSSGTALLGAVLLAAVSTAQRPLTVVERNGFTATSRLAEVRSFLDELRPLEPRGSWITTDVIGRSVEGRDILHVRWVDPEADADELLRVVVLANIHGGEVCGKEAVQILLRELALGEHDDWARAVDLHVVPVYEVDGNEKIATGNRSNVNGPSGGLGERENSEGLDLNRDLVKVAAPETEALLGLLNAVHPHAFLDLHTTDGSPHGWHLTYAPCLSPNADPRLDDYARKTLLPAVRAAMAAQHGYRVYDYGNFSRRDPEVYATFDHRPRFATNYVGLRNCVAVLSEAYAYEPFEVRVRASRAFVIEVVQQLVAEAARVRALCAAADRACANGDPSVRFAWDTSLAEGFEDDIAVSQWDMVPLEGGGTRIHRRSEFRMQPMRARVAFEAGMFAALPARGWAVLDPDPQVLARLKVHGLRFETLDGARQVAASRFVPTSGDKARRPFQGVREVTLRGAWENAEVELPPDTVVVPSRQPLARVAAQLLEPESEDSLATWGLFDSATELAADGRQGRFPVLRLR